MRLKTKFCEFISHWLKKKEIIQCCRSTTYLHMGQAEGYASLGQHDFYAIALGW